MDKPELKGLVEAWKGELNKIVVNCNLIPGSPKDEFDLLNNKLIGHLIKGAKEEKVHEVLESELIVRYGLTPSEAELKQFTNEVINWWNRIK